MQRFRALRVFERSPGFFDQEIVEQNISDLPEHEVLVRVHYSSLNYKDALSAQGKRGVTRHYPHTPGIDALGAVESSENPAFKPGDKVIVGGFDLGMNPPGGCAECIRVPARACVPVPERHPAPCRITLATA